MRRPLAPALVVLATCAAVTGAAVPTLAADGPPSSRTVQDPAGDSVVRGGFEGDPQPSAERIRRQDLTGARITIGADRVLLTEWHVGPLEANSTLEWRLRFRDASGELGLHSVTVFRKKRIVVTYRDGIEERCTGARLEITDHHIAASVPKSCLRLADGRWVGGTLVLSNVVADSGLPHVYDSTRAFDWVR